MGTKIPTIPNLLRFSLSHETFFVVFKSEMGYSRQFPDLGIGLRFGKLQIWRQYIMFIFFDDALVFASFVKISKVDKLFIAEGWVKHIL